MAELTPEIHHIVSGLLNSSELLLGNVFIGDSDTEVPVLAARVMSGDVEVTVPLAMLVTEEVFKMIDPPTGEAVVLDVAQFD